MKVKCFRRSRRDSIVQSLEAYLDGVDIIVSQDCLAELNSISVSSIDGSLSCMCEGYSKRIQSKSEITLHPHDSIRILISIGNLNPHQEHRVRKTD